MSSSSAGNSEYPGVSRLIVEWTDPDEIAFNWPFNANGREVRSVKVDGVEYVEVVRCIDCKHYELDDEPSLVYPDRYFCRKLCHFVQSYGFCAWGVRKDD